MNRNFDPRARMIKRLSCATGCGFLVIGLFAAGIVYVSCSNFFGNLMGEKTYKIQGDVTHFDPFAKLAEIRTHVPADARLISIEATFVRSDGTMDLNAKYTPFPQTTYTFERTLDKAPENAPPVGVGRGPNDVWLQEIEVSCWQPGQRRSVMKTGGGVSTKYQYTHLGIEVDEKSPTSGKPDPGIADPKCSTQKLWEIAIEKGASKDAVARIEYDKNGYEFRIDRTGVDFRCDENCAVKDR